MRKSEKSNAGWIFLGFVIILNIIMWIINSEKTRQSLNYAVKVFMKIIPIFIFVIVLMILVNYFFTPKTLKKHISKEAGKKRWLIAVIAGIISTGPIYAWYPMLNEIQKKGNNNGFIAAFLYNRAVKPALLPLMIFYFSLKFAIVLTIVMIVLSIIQGIIIEKITEVKK
ncbi:permease [Candidatus Woesearchaeota archaeon]|nr:MAG: permease [Candidatus Woesearchaeota archaeon ex4484_78]RLE45630.1 MAG: permease [Candidatus Woesearchaeota archaeon]